MLGYQLNKFPSLVLKYEQADHMLTLHGPLGISVYKSACFDFFFQTSNYQDFLFYTIGGARSTCSHTGLEVWQWTSIIFGLHILKKMSFLFNIFLLEEQRLSQNHSYLGHVDLCVFCLICTGTPSLLLLFAASSVVIELSSFLREVSGLYSSGSSILAIVFNKLQKPFMTTCSYPIVSKNNYCV